MNQIKVGNSQFIRDLNLSGIFKLIHQYGPVTRKELTENTGYSAATVSNHVKRLINRNFIIETEKGSSTGGRKPIYLTVNPDKGRILSIDIKVKQVKIVMFNLKLDVEEKKDFPVFEQDTPEGVIRQIYQEINRLLHNNNLLIEDILGLGIAVPGLINQEEGILEFAPNLGWKSIDIVKTLQERYPFPVALENEAKAAAIGEREFIYPGASNMVYISINEGIGCGIIINGQLFRGASGNAGEFGHIIIDSNGPECHCGNNGCWETLASENFIVNSYARENNIILNKKQIYQLGREGDLGVINIFKEAGKNIGIGLVNIINSLSPELLIIGGDITEIKDYLLPDIMNLLEEKALPVSYSKVTIKFSQLGNLATVYGLAKLIFEQNIKFV
jgi:N-acetylglucosamine repressor